MTSGPREAEGTAPPLSRYNANAGMSPQRAVEKVVNEKPDLHQKYIAAVNARR